jgi:8-amino-3,8-dideoxy-alpha-D-manno-octulosonate transaminase
MADRLVEAGVAEIFVTIHDPDEAGARQRLLPVLEKYPHLVYINSLKDQFLDTRAGLVEVPKREIRKKCYTEGIAITVDGDLLACCNDFLHSMQMGNIREQTIMEIWSSEKFREFRRKLRKGIPASKGCAYCFGLDIQHS